MTVIRPAIFASAFHPHIGGVEELVRQLAKEQLRRGLHPLVVTTRFPKDLPGEEIFEDIPIRRHVFRVPGRSARHLGGWALYAQATRRQIRRELKEHGADLVHVQCVSNNARYAVSAAHSGSLPLVVTMQGELSMDASHIYQRSAQMRRIWRNALDQAQMITSCSQYVLTEAEQHYGRGFGTRGRVIFNGIHLEDFDGPDPPPRDRPYILGIGRLVEQKGFDLLLEAFRSCARVLPDLELVIAGDGARATDLRRSAAASGFADRIVFLGSVNRRQAAQLFKGAEVFVLSSRHEPQGIVILEAMASRTATVAAAVGGVPELVRHEHNGLLFDGGSAEGLGAAVLRVLRDDGLRARLVANGRATAELHDWSAVAAAYSEVYAMATRSQA